MGSLASRRVKRRCRATESKRPSRNAARAARMARVLRVVALSGGHARDAANAILARNRGVIASFSRALTEGLSAQQSDAEFNAMLGKAVEGIWAASIAG